MVLPSPTSLVFTSLHPREGIYCLNPEIAEKAFQPDRSAAQPWRAASHFYRNKINTPRVSSFQTGKPRPQGFREAGLACGPHPTDAEWRAPTWNKMGTPLVSGGGGGLDLSS